MLLALGKITVDKIIHSIYEMNQLEINLSII